MKNKSLLMFALIVACIIPSIARANEKGEGAKKGPDPVKMMKKLDTDTSGTLSVSEAEANKKLSKHFAKIDKNSDGQVDMKELKMSYVKKEKKPKADDSDSEE